MVPNRDSARSEIAAQARELLVELCALSSPSGDVAGLRGVAARLAGELSRRGLSCDTTEERDADGVPQPVLVACGPAASERRLLLVGHMDTVLPAAPPRLVDDRLHATGALDMKGGLVTFVGALDLLAERGVQIPTGLTLVVVPDEESSGAISQRVVRRLGAYARAVLVLEPAEARGDGESLVAGRRGLSEWRLQVFGRPAHSGLDYWVGRSALVAAADWCVRAQRLSVRGAGRTVNVGRLVAGTTDFVEKLSDYHDLLGTSRQRNTIPDRAVAEGEVRFLTAADGVAALSELATLTERVSAEHEVTATLTTGLSVPPVDPQGPGKALVARAVELAAARGFRLEVEDDRAGISFTNYLADSTGVAVVDGLGPTGGGMHTPDEWVDLRSLDRRMVLLADLLATL